MNYKISYPCGIAVKHTLVSLYFTGTILWSNLGLSALLSMMAAHESPFSGVHVPVAQLLEHGASNAKVVGLIPREHTT